MPTNHPLRAIKRRLDAVLQRLSPLFDALYEELGRPSIPPEQLLKARVLTALYTVRSERLFCEQLGYNLLWLGNVALAPGQIPQTRAGQNPTSITATGVNASSNVLFQGVTLGLQYAF